LIVILLMVMNADTAVNLLTVTAEGTICNIYKKDCSTLERVKPLTCQNLHLGSLWKVSRLPCQSTRWRLATSRCKPWYVSQAAYTL